MGRRVTTLFTATKGEAGEEAEGQDSAQRTQCGGRTTGGPAHAQRRRRDRRLGERPQLEPKTRRKNAHLSHPDHETTSVVFNCVVCSASGSSGSMTKKCRIVLFSSF